MREYKWAKGFWLQDGHAWMMHLDIPKLPRVDTGDRVMLQPPPFWKDELPPVECIIYYVPEVNIYIAIGENAYKHLSVMFYDKLSVHEECHRRYPDVKWADEED